MGFRRYFTSAVEKKLEPRLKSSEAQIRQLQMDNAPQSPVGAIHHDFQEPKELHTLVRSRDDERFHRETLSKGLGINGLCLALLWHFRFGGFCDEPFTMRAA